MARGRAGIFTGARRIRLGRACGLDFWRRLGVIYGIEESLLGDIKITVTACALIFQPVNSIVGDDDTAGNDRASRKYS